MDNVQECRDNVKIHTISESDDDDSASYFLQPASSPYNICEKVKEANAALVNDNSSGNKLYKVKFSDDLVDYEPDMSDDNVSSIESEANIDFCALENDATELESQLQAALILNVCNTDDENEEIVEEIYEEIAPYENVVTFKQITELQSEIEDSKKQEKANTDTVQTNNKFKNKYSTPEDIFCKKHCIERFDHNLNISATKINLQQKNYECPRLKLQKRNCCEKNYIKTQQKLPRYGGLRSEYGLTEAQLDKRERIKEIIKMRGQERQKIIEENKKRRLEQNEQIFRDWLNSVTKRTPANPSSRRSLSTPLSSTVITFPNSSILKERPKTSYQECRPKFSVRKKRPTTSSACILIEVPQIFLHNGMRVGNLMVSKDAKLDPKTFHFLSVK